MAEQDSPGRRLVVGAAVVRDARVLAARRTTPAEAAGRWELPGGKVEDNETPAAALVREVSEELGCLVEVTRWLQDSQPIGETHLLRVAVCRITGGDPVPGDDHDAVRWLSAEEVGDVDWLEPDRPFLAAVRAALQEHP